MGRNHLHAISDSNTVEVAAIAEPQEDTRNALPSTRAKVYHSLEAMIDAGGIVANMSANEFDPTRSLTRQEIETITAHASAITEETWPGDPESAQAIAQL